MVTIVVTIKLPRNPRHNPHAKVLGPCPFTDLCSDSTGEHHSTVVSTEEQVQHLRERYHITRIEYL